VSSVMKSTQSPMIDRVDSVAVMMQPDGSWVALIVGPGVRIPVAPRRTRGAVLEASRRMIVGILRGYRSAAGVEPSSTLEMASLEVLTDLAYGVSYRATLWATGRLDDHMPPGRPLKAPTEVDQFLAELRVASLPSGYTEQLELCEVTRRKRAPREAHDGTHLLGTCGRRRRADGSLWWELWFKYPTSELTALHEAAHAIAGGTDDQSRDHGPLFARAFIDAVESVFGERCSSHLERLVRLDGTSPATRSELTANLDHRRRQEIRMRSLYRHEHLNTTRWSRGTPWGEILTGWSEVTRRDHPDDIDTCAAAISRFGPIATTRADLEALTHRKTPPTFRRDQIRAVLWGWAMEAAGPKRAEWVLRVPTLDVADLGRSPRDVQVSLERSMQLRERRRAAVAAGRT
jgi:hypothetical protein